MKKFVETVAGKIVIAVIVALLITFITGLFTVVVTAWNQPEINDQIRNEIKQGDSSIKETLRMRDNILIDKINEMNDNTKELIRRFDNHIDRKH